MSEILERTVAVLPQIVAMSTDKFGSRNFADFIHVLGTISNNQVSVFLTEHVSMLDTGREVGHEERNCLPNRASETR